jgi:hypothetical protein
VVYAIYPEGSRDDLLYAAEHKESEMDKDDIVIHLANTILISRIDGKVTGQEKAAIEKVRREIGATKGNLNKAFQIVDQGTYSIMAAGRFSDRVRNLEDMLFLSLMDGELHSSEKDAILSFAKKIKISQDQLKELVADAKKRVLDDVSEIPCNKCGKTISVNSNFCPECGAAANGSTTDDMTEEDFEIPSEGITIEFAESNAASFSDTLKSARLNPTFKKCRRSKKEWYCATWPTDQMPEASEIADNLSRLRNKKVYIDGKEQPWRKVFSFVACMKGRNEAYNPETYCFGYDVENLNIWGCQNTFMIWSYGGEWLSFGTFKDKKTFVFDKKRIWFELEKTLFELKYCPYLSLDYIKAVFKLFPDQAEVSENGPWDYNECWDEKPGAIKIRDKKYGDTIWVDGVKPKNTELAKVLIGKALGKCGLKPINLIG